MKLLLISSILSLAAAADFGRAGNNFRPFDLRSLEVDEVQLEFGAAADLSMSVPFDTVAAMPEGLSSGDAMAEGPGKAKSGKDKSEKAQMSKGSKSSKGVKSSKGHACPDYKGPVSVDDKHNEMYPRKLIGREILDYDEAHDEEETIMRITMELCPGESQITEGIDSGLGDYYRISPTNETIAHYRETGFNFNDAGYPNLSRAYSPTTILKKNYAEFLIKVERPTEACSCGDKCPKYVCCDGVCATGLTYMLLTADIGTTFLMTRRMEHAYWEDREVGYYAHYLNIDEDKGPYTINFIGGGIALTEINVVALSELLGPLFNSGVVGDVNYLWSNRYYDNMAWVYELAPINKGYPDNDLATTFSRMEGGYGSRVNVGLVFSREERFESPFPEGRFTQTTIEEFFGVTKKECGDQSENILWLVVGSSGFKKSTYELLDCSDGGLGFNLTVGLDDQYGINKEGPNALYHYLTPEDDPMDRKPSPVYRKYCDGEGLCKNL